MLFCKSCGASISGDKKCCPLCQQSLSGTVEPDSEIFPVVSLKKYNKGFLIKLVSFIAIAGAVTSIGVYTALPHYNGVRWWIFVIAGIFCGWLSAVTGILKRRNIFKNISWQLFIISASAVLWDVFTGWRGWSLDYVIPCSCAASMVTMYILSKIMKIDPRGFLLYLFFDMIYGIVPIVFIFCGILNVAYPSIACVALSVISISAILLFEGRNIRDELIRKFHI